MVCKAVHARPMPYRTKDLRKELDAYIDEEAGIMYPGYEYSGYHAMWDSVWDWKEGAYGILSACSGCGYPYEYGL